MKYFSELQRAMEWIGNQDNIVFLGQAVRYPGTAMSNTLQNVAIEKMIELPVAEEMQMGISIGLAMNGSIPVTIFPRLNFLFLAMNQLVNHLDCMPYISNGGYLPKLIIRTAIGSERPLHPQHQHVGDFTGAFRKILRNIDVVRLDKTEQIFPAYQNAYQRDDNRSSLIIEYGDYYNEK